jgi:NAD(P)-dependent dehydrogenase (short-subunit alcohol dehydrogenase family)
MSETANPTGGPVEGGGAHNEQVRVQHVSARVPERVSRGAFSTGAIVMTGGTEFILDFIQNLSTPPSVTARIVMPHATLPQFIEALRKNLDIYRQRFGEADELVGALLLLVSSTGGQFITGTHINVDGGFTAAWF